MEARPLDVTDRAALAAVVGDVVAEHGRLDVLDVNVRALMYGVAAALPHFRRQGGGHVVTIASVGAHQVVPTSAAYSATKYAAWAFTEGLRQGAQRASG